MFDLQHFSLTPYSQFVLVLKHGSYPLRKEVKRKKEKFTQPKKIIRPNSHIS